ncbi:MAG: PAS-domain containing protein [Pseudomonadota bacterium]
MRIQGRRIYEKSGERIGHILWFRADSDRAASESLANQMSTLTEERDTLRDLFNALPIPVWRRGRAGAIALANRAFAEIIGSPNSLGQPQTSSVGAEGGMMARTLDALSARAATTGMEQSENHHLVVDGQRRLFAFTEYPVPAPEPSSSDDLDLPTPGEEHEKSRDPILVGWAVDLTRADELEDDLERHLAAHAQVLGNLELPIEIYGPDKRLTFFNDAYVRVWDLDEEWLREHPTMSEVLDAMRQKRSLPEQGMDFLDYKRERLRMFTDLLGPTDEVAELPNGRVVRMTVSPHAMGGLILTHEDVTDRVQLERSYDTLIKVQRETLDHLFEGIAVFGQDGQLKLCNPNYTKIWNLNPDFVKTTPHISEIVAETEHFFKSAGNWPDYGDWAISRVTEPMIETGTIERADGLVLDFSCVPLPNGGVVFSFLDVTDSTDVERALRDRMDALLAADRMKSEFIADVSHELRTPLNAVVGFADMLSNEYSGTLNDKQSSYVAGILDSGNRLVSLINDILDLASLEAGHTRLECETMEMGVVLDSVLALLSDRLARAEITIELVVESNLPPLIADERRLKQALYNLLNDVIKASQPGGTVAVALESGSGTMVLSVIHGGSGKESSSNSEGQGEVATGDVATSERSISGRSIDGGTITNRLGLSLVHRFVDLHQGSVTVSDLASGGEAIMLRIPLEPPPEVSEALAFAAGTEGE